MIIKIFNRGKSRGEGPIGYLLGEKFIDGGDIRAGARVLSGDAFITQELINSSNFSKRYTSGVLSFEERPDQISEQDKKKIMQDFEQSMFPGMYPDRVNFLWVEHTDKKNPKTDERRLELNFVIPTTELYTGKRLQPYYHVMDAKYFRAWQTLTNDRFGLTDPDDPTHYRLTNKFDSNQSPKKTFENLKDDIAEYLKIQMTVGLIENREDVIWQIENIPYRKIKVTRRSDNFISIITGDNKKPIRLKGFLFEKNFSYSEYLSRIKNDPNISKKPAKKVETDASKHNRLEKARTDFINIYEHKKKQNLKKYQISQDEINWVTAHYAPFEILENVKKVTTILTNESQETTPITIVNEQKNGEATQKNNEKIIKPQSLVSSNQPTKNLNGIDDNQNISKDNPNSNPSNEDDYLEQLRQVIAMKKARAKTDEQDAKKLKERLNLEAQNRQRQQEIIKQRQQAQEEQLRAIRSQMMIPLHQSFYQTPDAYDQGYKKFIHLVKDNFPPALNQKTSEYSNTLRLNVGRFDNKLNLTRDGRMGFDYSPYSNVSDFKFFYSSDLFEIKQEKLYVKNTDIYYELSQFSDTEKMLIEESIANSDLNKADRFTRPEGLENAFITYSSDLDQLPNHQLITELKHDEQSEDSANRTSKKDHEDDPKPDEDYGPKF